MINKDKIPRELRSLPTPFLRCLLDDQYDKGQSEFSTTQLIGAPQKTWLGSQGHEEVRTPTSVFYATLGTILHRILEDYAKEEEGEIAERRLYATIQGRVVSGCIDLYETSTRTVSDWKFIGGDQSAIKEEHRKQLLINGRLAELNDWEVEHLSITYFIRDWKMLQAIINPTAPQIGIKCFVIPYDREEAIKLLNTCVSEHIAATEGNPRECSLEEKWQDPPIYAVMKNGGKRAVNGGKCGSMAEAQSLIDKLGSGHHVQTRPATRTMCDYLCAFKAVCPQYRRESVDFETREEP